LVISDLCSLDKDRARRMTNRQVCGERWGGNSDMADRRAIRQGSLFLAAR
jgi:hypothetical protein